MRIAEINNINPAMRINHKGGISSLNTLNPIAHYMDRYVNKAAKVTTNRVEPISPKLFGKVNIIHLDNNASAWDINPAESDEYIFFLHGMTQNVSNNQHLYTEIAEKNKGVFAVEYRGYGENKTEKVSEDKLKKDVVSAYNYLTDKKGIKPENITVIGHSMGGALATDFASKNHDIKSLILVAPLCKMSYLGEKFIKSKTIGPGIPNLVQNLTEKIKFLKTLMDLRFNSINKMKKNKVPTYILQSKNDMVTTYHGTRQLIKTARRQGILKNFVYFRSGGHRIDSEKIKIISEILDIIYQK